MMKLFHDDNWMQLDRGNVIAINGLDGYAVPNYQTDFIMREPDKPSNYQML